MAIGEFYTYTVWELRPGHQGRELEELTRLGVIPQYNLVQGVVEIKLFRIEEGDDAGKYLAVTVYENRDAFNRWFTSNGRDFAAWNNNMRPTLERWVDAAGQTRVHRATLLLDHQYQKPTQEEPPPTSGAARIVF